MYTLLQSSSSFCLHHLIHKCEDLGLQRFQLLQRQSVSNWFFFRFYNLHLNLASTFLWRDGAWRWLDGFLRNITNFSFWNKECLKFAHRSNLHLKDNQMRLQANGESQKNRRRETHIEFLDTKDQSLIDFQNALGETEENRGEEDN